MKIRGASVSVKVIKMLLLLLFLGGGRGISMAPNEDYIIFYWTFDIYFFSISAQSD